MNPGMRAKIFIKKLHQEQGWEKPLVNIAKEKLSQWGCFFVYFDETFDNNNNSLQRNTGNLKSFSKFYKFRRYIGKIGDQEVETGVSLGGLEEMEHICQLIINYGICQLSCKIG